MPMMPQPPQPIRRVRIQPSEGSPLRKHLTPDQRTITPPRAIHHARARSNIEGCIRQEVMTFDERIGGRTSLNMCLDGILPNRGGTTSTMAERVIKQRNVGAMRL